MKRIATLAALILLSSHTALAADAKPDVQAEMKKMQEAQAKLMSAMMLEKKSRLGFDETVAGCRQEAWLGSRPGHGHAGSHAESRP